MSALGGSGGPGVGHPFGVRRLRIAVLVKTNAGGLWLLPQVEELRHRGHEVTVVLPRGAGRLTDELERRGFEVLSCPYDFTIGWHVPIGLLRLRALLRRLRPDVVQYHLIASAYAVRLATLGLPVRRVHMVAGPAYLESRLVRSVERWMWQLDDVVICGCRYASARYGELGCPPQRRPVAVYGVDTDAFSPEATGPDQRAKLRAELGIDQAAFLAVMVSYVHPPKRLVHSGRGVKGHDVLLAAWRTFRRRHPDAHLLLVGGGWTAAGESYRRQLGERFGVADDPGVTWVESVPDVRPCYAAADVSVSPSLCDSPGTAVEAGSMGVPSIVSAAGGLPEAVTERSGWVVPAADPTALVDALDAAYRGWVTGTLTLRGRLARQHVLASFDDLRAAAEVADIVEDVAARRR
ncbi:glycosyltransferase [Micromonospora ureilytica]|uniref:Glycosyltransferase involved in cell wall biosynthesis n=1 Tax=Micromonospora ureilytica TaxID=709868 RepID=A0ABS0JHZ5_9ACTN|nr:glycosyltransferase [Micromonospora ureilytica]MBG6066693.1 glycosyltransferase involved in cell wall biosynthesis [Micromonospora ureilytica]